MKHLSVAIIVGFIFVFGALGLGMYGTFLWTVAPKSELFLLGLISLSTGLWFHELALHSQTKKEFKKYKQNNPEQVEVD